VNLLTGTRLRLALWARWMRGGIKGFPTCSAFMSEGHGGAIDAADLPPDIEEVNQAVNRAEPPNKRIIVVAYTQGGSRREQEQRMNLSRWSFKRRLEHAEWEIKVALDSPHRNP
jgi:hypothetical protein